MRPSWLRVSLVVVCLLGLSALARSEDAPASWSDAQAVEAQLGPACDAVEAVCGVRFVKRPTVRVSEAEDIARVLITDFAALPEQLLAPGDRGRLARVVAPFLLAKYDSEEHVIHVQPRAAALAAEAQEDLEPLGLEHLRVLLAHEATHALDYEHYGIMARRKQLPTADEHQALGAVVEGHAQWVAEQVAHRWELDAAFERLTQAIVGGPKADGDAQQALVAASLAEIRFAYGQGHAFFRAVAEARGAEGVDAVLRDPPRRSRRIEHPAEYLEPATAPSRDLAAVARAFQPLVGAPPWEVQDQRVLEAALRSQAMRVPAERRGEYLQGYVDAHALVGMVPGEDLRVVALVAQFDTPEHARLFTELERLLCETAQESPPALTFETKALVDGTGTEGKVPGFTMHRVVHAGEQTIPVHQQVFHVDGLACEVIAMNVPGLERAAMDPVVDYVARVIADPEGAAKLTPPTPVPFASTHHMLTVRVLDADGTPVPDCHVETVQREGDGSSTGGQHRCLGGELRLPLPKGKIEVRALRARGRDGAALDLAPSAWTPVPEDADTLELELEKGRRIAGRVLTEAGGPAAGLVVEALRAHGQMDEPGWAGDADARTDADGRFDLAGLGDEDYVLRLRRATSPPWDGQRSAALHAGTLDVELKWKELPTFEVTVVDADGHPVPGVHVMAYPRGSGQLVQDTTDDEGIARLRATDPEQTYRLEAQIERECERDDVASTNLEDWKPEATRIVLEPGWTLRGVVVDEQGTPMAATVHHAVRDWSTRTFPTEADGRFEINGLPMGPAKVAATEHGDDTHDVAFHKKLPWTEFPPTKERVELRVTRPDESGVLRVRVEDPDGNPVPRVRVRVGRLDEDGQTFRSSQGTVALRGKAHFDRPQAPFCVEAFHAQSAGGGDLPLGPVRRVAVAPEEGELVLRMGPARRVTGLVRKPNGEPAAGVRVWAAPKEESLPREWDAHGVAVSAPDGSFVLVSLGARDYLLQVEPPSPAEAPEPTPLDAGSTSVTIQLVEPITLHVVDDRGEPVPGAQVVVVRIAHPGPGEWHFDYPFSAETDERGDVTTRPFQDGIEYELRISPPGTVDPGVPPPLRSSRPERHDLFPLRLRPWDGKPATFTLRTAFELSGVVRDGKGAVDHATIEAWTAPFGKEEDWNEVARSGDDGHFHTQRLPRGPVRLRAVKVLPGDRGTDEQRSAVVEAAPGSGELTLLLEPLDSRIVLRLAGANEDWSGWLVRDGGGTVIFEFGADGHASVADLIAGTYTVYVPDPEDETRCVYATGLAADGAPVTLSFVPTHAVRFRVEAVEGMEEVNASVVGPAGESFEAERAADGTYVARGLPPGTWRAVAYARVGIGWYQGAADTDGKDVPTLVLKPLTDGG